MFVLIKPASDAAHDRTPEALERAVSSLASDIAETANGTIYKISSLAPLIRCSMFAPFSEVELERYGTSWLLRLRPSKVLLLPFAAALIAFPAFRTIGPIGSEGVLTILGVPTLVVLLALGEARLRIGGWWRRI